MRWAGNALGRPDEHRGEPSNGREESWSEGLEASLMAKIGRGDPEAFRRVVERYQRLVLNLCYRFTGDCEASRDIAQEIFLKVYGSASSYRPYAPLASWIYRVAVNHCLNHVRDRGRNGLLTESLGSGRPGGSRDPTRSVHAAPPASPEEEVSRKEAAALVREAVLKLPARQRMAVVLQRYHGMRYVEIARAMDCSVGAVESLLVRATDTLRQSLSHLLTTDEGGSS